MKLHIATVGIDYRKRVEFVVMNKGADHVILVCSEESIEIGKSICTMFSSKGIECETIIIDPWNYENILAKTLEAIVEQLETGLFSEIEFNGSCGTRIMTATVYMAAMIIDAPIYLVGRCSEGDDIGEAIMLRPMPISMLTSPKKMILQSLKDRGGKVDSQTELGSRTELGADSISKHIRDLEKARYVKCHQHGRRKAIELTHLGEMALELKYVKRTLEKNKRKIRARNRGP
ncbi:MAG: DUF6293 family protein [Candidatus Thorarchaeota archaeon]|nr:DUF6293 family protein [Candidatus Thorarchaeota archaeon]